jgi:hypothetical protein
MAGGNRGIVWAAGCGFVLILLGTIAFVDVLNSGGRQSQPVAAQPHQADRDRAGLPSLAERAIGNPDPATPDERDKRNLAAQEATAAFAFWMIIVALVQAAVAAIGIYFLRRTIQQGQEALNHARAISYLELRAYVSIGRPVLTHSGKNWVATFPILNTGQTPATDVEVRSFSDFASHPLVEADLKDKHEKREPTPPYVVGPHSDRAHWFTWSVTPSRQAAIDAGSACFVVRMQVSYTTYKGERIHEGPFDWIARKNEFEHGTLARGRSSRDYA